MVWDGLRETRISSPVHWGPQWCHHRLGHHRVAAAWSPLILERGTGRLRELVLFQQTLTML